MRGGDDSGISLQSLVFGPEGLDSGGGGGMAGGVRRGQRGERIPAVPTSTNGIGDRIDVHDVPTVFAGRWGDTLTALDPAIVRGKVAVFSGPVNPPPRPAAAGTADSTANDTTTSGGGGGRGGGRGGAAGQFGTANDPRPRDGGRRGGIGLSLDFLPPNMAHAPPHTPLGMA